MEILFKICEEIQIIPPECLMIVIPILMLGAFKNQFLHVSITTVLAIIAFVIHALTAHQHHLWSYSNPAFNQSLYQAYLISYPILFVGVNFYAAKILFISIGKFKRARRKSSPHSASISTTKMEAVG